MLGFGSYETAWAWMHKLRRAMVRPDRDLLSSEVGLDETFIGGVTAGTDGAGTDKLPVMVAVERVGPKRLGRVRFRVASAPGSLGLLDFATDTITTGSTVRTDGARVLRRLPERMELPEDQQRILSDIEAQLAQESSRLAEELDQHRITVAPWGFAAGLLVISLGLFAAAFGTATGWTVLMVCGLVSPS